MDLEEIDFGFCDMAMGIALVGGECVYVSGFGWEVGAVDYSRAFYTSFEFYEEGCLETLDCVDVAGLDFGECLAVLGIENVGENCICVSGCSTYFNGVDYSFAVYKSFEDCNAACFPEPGGCTYSVALNFNTNATLQDGSCLFPECVSNCAGDLNRDDSVTVKDILQFLSTFGLICN